MHYVDIFGHLSFLLAAFSFLMRDIIWLRIISIISGLIGIIFNFLIPAGPLWIPIMWLTIFICINIYMITSFYYSNRSSGFSENDLNIWKNNFWGLTAEEFRKVRKIMELKSFNNEKIISKGQETKYIYFILSGKLNIKINNSIVNVLSVGDVAGEMSFLNETEANADVFSETNTKCIALEKAKLRKFMIRSPAFHVSVTKLFNKNLMKKIAQ